MNDSTEKPKPAIFYAKNTDSNKSSRSEKGQGKGKNDSLKEKRKDGRTDKRNDNRTDNRSDRPFQSKPKREQYDRNDRRNDRIETFKPYSSKPNYTKPNSAKSESYRSDTSRFDDSSENSSPWKKKVRDNEQLPTFTHDERRQRKEETLVYSENSCKAVFKHRPASIVKAFITQEMTYHFKDLIEWLVSQHLGYDVVESEQITKMVETPHHGGICLIIKKRQPMMLTTYLEQNQNNEQDHVLAIDDVNNPHNLGGLVRTAAFYGINGLMLRQTNLLESGAAMRVAEGGTESVTPIKTDDFVASLDLLKQKGYQIIALLPCQVKSVDANELHQLNFNKKTVLVIFQQINMKLIHCADEVIYLKGSDNMAALNISVATGILLSHMQKNN